MDRKRTAVLRDHAQPPRAHLHFPSTSWDLLADAARHGDRFSAALAEFADRYYAAVRAYIAAIARDPVAADDLTQHFFETVVLSGRLLTHADRGRGAFRPYLKQAIRNFLVDERRRRARTIGGDVHPDAVDGGWNLIATDPSPGPDAELLRAWARSLVAIALARLERLCEVNAQAQHYQLFVRRYLTDPDCPPSWREVGAPFGLPEKIARSRAETAARHFRALLRNLIATDLGSGQAVEDELRTLMAVL